MKRFLIILLFITPVFCSAQEYSEVVPIPGKTADQLYTIAREWYALTFKSAQDVIQMEDPVKKEIIGKGYSKIEYKVKKSYAYLNMYFTLQTLFRDNRYKYSITVGDLKTDVSEPFSYSKLKDMTTVEGVTTYFKNEKLNVLTNKRMKQNIAAQNKVLVSLIDNRLQSLVDELTANLKKDTTKDNNW